MKKFLPTSYTFGVNNIKRLALSKAKGFTLIELLVVISIIAFLSVAGMAAFSGAQKTARDGRRRADLDAIAKALESNYNAVLGTYPNNGAFTDTNYGTYFVSGKVPVDPVNSSPQVYTVIFLNSYKGFSVCVTLETTNNQGNASSAGDASNYPTFASGNIFCKVSQQNK